MVIIFNTGKAYCWMLHMPRQGSMCRSDKQSVIHKFFYQLSLALALYMYMYKGMAMVVVNRLHVCTLHCTHVYSTTDYHTMLSGMWTVYMYIYHPHSNHYLGTLYCMHSIILWKALPYLKTLLPLSKTCSHPGQESWDLTCSSVMTTTVPFHQHQCHTLSDAGQWG